MPTFRRSLSRRWLLAFLGGAALLFGLAMLHPYPRQSLFGPTIRGKPWCVWEAKVRRYANGDWDSWFFKMMESQGFEDGLRTWEKDLNDPDFLPLFLHLAEDADPKVRCMAIGRFSKLQETAALPVLRRRLTDEDARCRFSAATAIWYIAKDRDVIPTLVGILKERPEVAPENKNAQGLFRSNVVLLLYLISFDNPELYDDLAAFKDDPDFFVRSEVMRSMESFGQKGVIVLRDGLKDPVAMVREQAAHTLGNIGGNAKESLQELELCLDDPSPRVRLKAAEAIRFVDTQRFLHLKAERKIE
jgi:HEAT repeat protein